MEISEFIEGINKLQKYYDKEYTEEQRKIMFDRLKYMSAKEFNRAIINVLDENKYLPKIIDIKNALIQPKKVENEKQVDFVKCDKCCNGFVPYFKSINDGGRHLKYPFVALCTCENGKFQREVYGYDLPFINEVMKL